MKKALLVSILLCLGLIIWDKTYIKLIFIATTDPPSVLMVKNLEEQIGCAKKAGFVFKKPMLRIIKQPYSLGSPHGFAYMDLNIITLVYFASYDTLAHELGHIIDYQMDREGHPVFKNRKDWNIEVIADAIRDVILEECKSSVQ